MRVRRYETWPYAFAILAGLLMTAGATAAGQQQADPDFNASVARPAFTDTHPRVFFDEGHNNFHTAGGRYKPFADWITNDGYRVSQNKAKFRQETLSGNDVLVIANALGAALSDFDIDNRDTFSQGECDAVRDWVEAATRCCSLPITHLPDWPRLDSPPALRLT